MQEESKENASDTRLEVDPSALALPSTADAADLPLAGAPLSPEDAQDARAAATHRQASRGLDDGEYRHPSPMHLRLERIGGLIGLVVMGLIGGTAVSALWFFGPLEGAFRFLPFLAWLIVLSLTAFTGLHWPSVSHRHRRYRLDPESIEIQKGVLWRSSVTVPCSRVQHADVAQGPLERRLGLATLTLHTAGTDHASVTLEGIEYDRALALRDHLVGAADRVGS